MTITEAEREAILASYFDGDRLKELPAREKRKLVVLGRLAEAFQAGRRYSEKEVNETIMRFHADTAAIRRYLVYYGFMDREPGGGEYWIKE